MGNEAFAKFVSEQGDRNYRITHFNDPVPIVPPFWQGWRHVEPEFWLRGGPWNRVDYEPRDIGECHNWAEKGCIEGCIGLGLGLLTNSSSHGYYLSAISLCGNPSGSVEIGDEPFWDSTENEELRASLQKDYIMDIEYAASQHNSSLLAEYRWRGCVDNL